LDRSGIPGIRSEELSRKKFDQSDLRKNPSSVGDDDYDDDDMQSVERFAL
jgi:hypothetical protein